MIKLTAIANTLEYYTPYNPTIAKKCRNLGGSWHGVKAAWVFKNDKDTRESLNSINKEVFGFSLKSKRVSAYIHINRDVESEKAPYVVGGCVLASARGRDSGAKVGEGVRLLNGDIDSGGSFKNWTSTIGANSKFKIESFPSDYDLNSHKDYKDIKIELIEFENIGFDEDEVITFQVSSLVEKLVDLGLTQSQINSILEL